MCIFIIQEKNDENEKIVTKLSELEAILKDEQEKIATNAETISMVQIQLESETRNNKIETIRKMKLEGI